MSKFFEKSIIDDVCLAFTRWNGWGPPTSEYQIMEFCQARATSEVQAEEYTQILVGWMSGEYSCKLPLWLDE